MFGFIDRLFKPAEKICTIEGYWVRTPIALDTKTSTSFGGKVNAVTALVDVDFAAEGQNMKVRAVRLSRQSPNVAAVQRKEIWHAKTICSDADMLKAVAADLEDASGYLHKAMVTRWRNAFGKAGGVKKAIA